MEKNINRRFNFGKHKGELIFDVIRIYPAYVEWVLNNISWFKLNDEEELFYHQTCKDWLEAWNNVRYAFKTGPGASKEMYKTVELYKKDLITKDNKSRCSGVSNISSIQEKFSQYIESDEYNEIDDICLGSNPMCLF